MMKATLNKYSAIDLSIETYKKRLEFKKPIYSPKYRERYGVSEKDYNDYFKCGFCILHKQDCEVCEYGDVYGECNEEGSKFITTYVDQAIGDEKLSYPVDLDTHNQHKAACQEMIDSLEDLRDILRKRDDEEELRWQEMLEREQRLKELEELQDEQI